jgi:hypothetical protein
MEPVPVVVPASAANFAKPVTPQILAEYFKPSPAGRTRNHTALFIPAEFGMAPPPPPLPANQSKAVYKIE